MTFRPPLWLVILIAIAFIGGILFGYFFGQQQ